jgi:hypothetical protein
MTSNPILNVPEDTGRERMTTIIIDIESQNEYEERLNTPLRGILKNPEPNRENDEIFEARVTSACISLVLIIIWIPIIVMDLDFGFFESNCTTKEPNDNSFIHLIKLKIYLLVSGFVGIVSLGAILTAIYLFDPKLDRASNIYLYNITFATMYLTSLFLIIWNIMGAITFWGFIFNNKTCGQDFINYMYVSLVIKLISSLYTIYGTYSAISSY